VGSQNNQAGLGRQSGGHPLQANNSLSFDRSINDTFWNDRW